jgi:hypothetical protein
MDSFDYDKQIKVLEDKIKELRLKKEIEKNFKIPDFKIDFNEFNKLWYEKTNVK